MNKPLHDKTDIKNVGNFWISGMKTIAWIAFFGIIVCGVALAVSTGNLVSGLLVFMLSIIVAFLSVAVLMIFLSLAQDISTMRKDTSEIKQYLREIRNDKHQN